MKKWFSDGISLWQLAGFAVVSFLGTLLHFLYDWTNGNVIAALISGVNESTWEHMKLLFFPMLLFAGIQSRFVTKEYPAFWCIKLRGVLLGLALIPILFYTLGGCFGPTPDFVNIGIFFVAAAAAFLYETNQFRKGSTRCAAPKLALLVLCLIAIAFWSFTFLPPRIPLFSDPIGGGFGI